ncbi:uncharacterized protein LOC132303407 [Cornus florida]|uniref:uncharacterized protein LOC132303407 n=1 Tax=Cornus florida TaxID=4283 RepID=UPI002899D0F9|nr:uncharacterized protein LOC132303407 [Cornus florida]
MKMRNKGKVYPSPSSSSSSSSVPSHSAANRDAFSVLKLLPTAILALASVLSLEDREVLAYMITRSMMMSASNPSSIGADDKKKKSAKKSDAHKPPVFDCGCFDCYTSYWFRWDSSPNRELIHQAIEAFEEHLANGEKSKKREKGKKREKLGRQSVDKTADVPDATVPEIEKSSSSSVGSPEKDSSPPEKAEETAEKKGEEEMVESETEEVCLPGEEEEASTTSTTAMVLRSSPASNHKGMARKVLPDVLGLLNSRLWSLWNPNV